MINDKKIAAATATRTAGTLHFLRLTVAAASTAVFSRNCLKLFQVLAEL